MDALRIDFHMMPGARIHDPGHLIHLGALLA